MFTLLLNWKLFYIYWSQLPASVVLKYLVKKENLKYNHHTCRWKTMYNSHTANIPQKDLNRNYVAGTIALGLQGHRHWYFSGTDVKECCLQDERYDCLSFYSSSLTKYKTWNYQVKLYIKAVSYVHIIITDILQEATVHPEYHVLMSRLLKFLLKWVTTKK